MKEAAAQVCPQQTKNHLTESTVDLQTSQKTVEKHHHNPNVSTFFRVVGIRIETCPFAKTAT